MVSVASFLALTAPPKSPNESRLLHEDRALTTEYLRLMEKKDRTEDEEKKLDELNEDLSALIVMRHGCVSERFADSDHKAIIKRIYRELRSEYGDETASKKLLLDRLTAAYSMSLSYERLLQQLKYRVDADGKLQYQGFMPNVMKEVRKGIESGNDQTIRLLQALRDLTRPSLTVKATNAFIAQNQQVNQGVAPPTDLENDSLSVIENAPRSRRKSTAARS